MSNDHAVTLIAIGAKEPIVRYGFRKLLETEQNLNVIGEAANSSEVIKLVLDLKPEVLLLDLEIPPSGLEVLSRLTSAKPPVHTLLLASPADKNKIAEAFSLGARGVVLKGSATRLLLNGIRGVIAEQYWVWDKAVGEAQGVLRSLAQQDDSRRLPSNYRLTPRELEIIATIVTGCSNKDVGRKFSITERTVKHHLTNIYDKLGVSNRLELALFAVNKHLDVYESPRRSPSHVRAEAKYAEAL